MYGKNFAWTDKVFVECIQVFFDGDFSYVCSDCVVSGTISLIKFK